ncbi:MAG: thioredoxin family protein [Bdellovibrionota bacterium]
MALTYSVKKELGKSAPDFRLKGVDGSWHSLADYSSRKAIVVVFMCNHCPYIIAIQERLNVLAKEYQPRNAEVIGINSNDAKKYPDDDFRAMQIRAKEMGYVFPYLWDETQTVAKAYDAVCTPDLYLFENEALGHKVPDFKLRYHGRLDDNWKDPRSVKRRDLALALDAVLAGLPVPAEQIPSMGCSIKWKT